MTRPTTSTRPATAEDAAAISALIDGLAHYFLVDPDDRASASVFFESISTEAIAGYLADPAYRYHVATTPDGNLVGVVAFRDDRHLFHLFVASSHHRQGLARHLFETGWKAAGSPRRSTVFATPYAVRVYERLGFVTTGDRVEQDGIAFVPMVREAEPRPG